MRSGETTSRRWSVSFKGVDLFLLVTVVGLVLFGLLMVYSSSFIFAEERTGDGFAFIKKQIFFAVLGFTALMAGLKIPYSHWSRWSLPLMVGVFVLLLLVFVPSLGAKVGGASRWLRLGPFQFQPGELAKFAVVVFVARQLVRKQERLHDFRAGILSPFLLTLPIFVLLLAQPDLGTILICAMTVVLLIFLAGTPLRHLSVAMVAFASVTVALVSGSEYRLARLTAFLNPWDDPAGRGFQILQSLVAVHQGGFWGMGLGNGKEKLFYLPEAHNDFIFAVVGEELGFFGLALVAAAFGFFFYRGFRIAWRSYAERKEMFGFYLASGITLLIGMQAFVNMAVVLGLLPTKGLNLPFVSYGGSALVVQLFAIGVLLNIGKESHGHEG